MPQLNPSPWFMILCLSWTALLILFSSKITSTHPQHHPLTHSQTPHKTAPWNWPWA